MYGMVNQALKEFILQKAGLEAWQKTANAAKESGEDYILMKAYGDEITYTLVAKYCEHLACSSDEMLFEFGMYWVEFALKSSYRNLLLGSADNLFDMLRALDKMHSQIGKSLSQLKPPSFRVKDIDAQTVHLLYYSDRPGLVHFVRGIVTALGALYKQHPRISVADEKNPDANYTTYTITIDK
jgi:guanylate cyclase, other